MNILYVKNGSERDKKFQLQTVIFEENGQKYVKKQALCNEAIPHLKKMKDNYHKLTASITNPKIKLAKIVDESEDSLTFEFIEGESFAKRLEKFGNCEEKIKMFINEYRALLIDSFKTTKFNSKNITQEFKKIFGDFDYSILDGEICFKEISNIDLIFSNIIYKNNQIYIIDYEWVFGCSLPVSFCLYRSLINKDLVVKKYSISSELYYEMEYYFIEQYVYKKSFFKYQNNYNKKRFSINEKIKKLEQKIQEQEDYIQIKEQKIQEQENYIQIKVQQLLEQDQQLCHKECEIQNLIAENRKLSYLAESMRIKNRIKNIFHFKKKY